MKEGSQRPVQGSYQREVVEGYLEALGRIVWRNGGRVWALYETPRSGVHVPCQTVMVLPGKGFAGDHPKKSFYRGQLVPGREVSAVSLEVLRVLEVDPAVVGDNLITEGFELGRLEAGDRVRIGAGVILRRSERPHQVCTVFRDRTSPEAFAVMGRDRYRGALFVVEQGGWVRVGDTICPLDTA